jgi:hypothetical protein
VEGRREACGGTHRYDREAIGIQEDYALGAAPEVGKSRVEFWRTIFRAAKEAMDNRQNRKSGCGYSP